MVGDEVLTHRARWRQVTAIGSEDADLVKVKGQGHWGMVTTANHPFLTGDDEWTEAGNLAGRRWRTVASVPSLPLPPLENIRGVMLCRGRWRATGWRDGRSVYLGQFDSKDEAIQRRIKAIARGEIDVRGADGVDPSSNGFARFLGYWIGDGWTSGSSVLLCGSRDDGPLLEQILLGAGMAGSISMERTSARSRVGSQALVKWLGENFGSTAAGKRLPAWIHGMSAEWRAQFLFGYSEADGHVEGGVQRFTTVSRFLAVGIRVLLNQQGVSASIVWHRTGQQAIEGRQVMTAGGFYRITSYQRARSFSFNNTHGIGYVRSVEPAGRGRVFNIAVSEDESYTADGIAVHNCQPFSSAGKGDGFDDPRHLWPHFFRIIQHLRPSRVVGEQVASPDALVWWDAVCTDLEGAGYAGWAADLCSAGIGAPHIRQRLYWVADTDTGRDQGRAELRQPGDPKYGYTSGGLADAERHGDRGQAEPADHHGPQADRSTDQRGGCGGASSRLANAHQVGREPLSSAGQPGEERDAEPRGGVVLGWSSPSHGIRRDADWLHCRDGKWRQVKPGLVPLVDGLPRGVVPSSRISMEINADKTAEARAMRLKGYGNAIDPELAAMFLRAVS